MEESKELEAINEGDNVICWIYVESREHEGRFYSSIKGSYVKVLIAGEGNSAISPVSKEEKPSTTDDDEDVPF